MVIDEAPYASDLVDESRIGVGHSRSAKATAVVVVEKTRGPICDVACSVVHVRGGRDALSHRRPGRQSRVARICIPTRWS